MKNIILVFLIINVISTLADIATINRMERALSSLRKDMESLEHESDHVKKLKDAILWNIGANQSMLEGIKQTFMIDEKKCQKSFMKEHEK